MNIEMFIALLPWWYKILAIVITVHVIVVFSKHPKLLFRFYFYLFIHYNRTIKCCFYEDI